MSQDLESQTFTTVDGTCLSMTGGFGDELGIHFTAVGHNFAEAVMPITPRIFQPFGYVHGGATLALLETVGSQAAACDIDLSKERVFGIRMDVRHKKSGQTGSIRGVAKLDRMEGSHGYWSVIAYDDAGDVMSEGIFETKRVTLEYLAEKEAKRRAAKDLSR